ncbi:MAG TPA: hydrogenase maturation nickel metallochaperone HypA [Dongiaceae bacterium]|nr:hydrogenase maturation nickel metallochaperone HypA [Dongiaceae bacterium]
MHELGLAVEIHRRARSHVEAHARARLARVVVAIGELSAVEPDLLRFAWQAVTAGSPDEGALLEIQWCPARQRCPACGGTPERAAGTWLASCPRCGEALRVEGGTELDLLRVVLTVTDHAEIAS